MDSLTINYGTKSEPILRSDKCLARLILEAAVIRQPNEKKISLIDKIQNPHHRLGQWHFQGKRRTAALTREFIDRTLPRLLSRWYPHPDNNKGGNLSFNKLGTFTRQYKADKVNDRTVAGDTAMGQGTQNDNFLLKSADLVGTNIVVGLKQYAWAKQTQ